VDSVGRIENAREPILAARQEPALEVGVHIESVDLARVFLDVDVFQRFGMASTDARDVVGKDSAVCASCEDHGVAVPLNIADIQLVGSRRLDGRRLGRDRSPHISAVAEVEIEACRIIEDNRLENVRPGEGDGALVRGDIEAGDGHAGSVHGVLGLGRSICRRARGRRGIGDGVAGGVWRRLCAEELAHNARLARIHDGGGAATATPSAARLRARVASPPEGGREDCSSSNDPELHETQLLENSCGLVSIGGRIGVEVVKVNVTLALFSQSLSWRGGGAPHL
jgi:hypothetical protein